MALRKNANSEKHKAKLASVKSATEEMVMAPLAPQVSGFTSQETLGRVLFARRKAENAVAILNWVSDYLIQTGATLHSYPSEELGVEVAQALVNLDMLAEMLYNEVQELM